MSLLKFCFIFYELLLDKIKHLMLISLMLYLSKYEITLVFMNLDPISTAYNSLFIYILMLMKVVANRRKIQIAFALV